MIANVLSERNDKSACRKSSIALDCVYARDIEMLRRATINSDGCRVFGTYCGRIVSGCRGLQPSELFSAAIQRGTDPARRVGGTAKVNGHKAGDSVQSTRPNCGHASQYKRVSLY